MAEIALPKPDQQICTCPHCGRAMKIDPLWYQYLVSITRLINQGL